MLEQADLEQIAAMTAAAIEENLKNVTDRIDMLDPLIQGKQHMYFVCLHSGLFYPADYIKQWGKKYGIGHGGEPRSECLDTEYNTRPALDNIRSIADIMHPCKISGAPLDVIYASQPAAPGQMLVTQWQDRNGTIRGKLMRAKQLSNPLNQIAALTSIAVKEGLVYQEPTL